MQHLTVSRMFVVVVPLIVAVVCAPFVREQALTMDGESAVFFASTATVIPSTPARCNGPTLSYHMVIAGPIAGDYFNVSLEDGFGNWLEFGYTRGNHSDGGDPTSK